MRKSALVALSCLVLSTGCVMGRRITALEVPSPAIRAAPTKARVIFGPVTDERTFENKPSEPSTPSIDGDVNQVPREQLKGIIGRQRNSYGKAMGDIGLPAGETVETQAQKLVQEGLAHHGYAIGGADPSPNRVTVKITQFWAWFTPGMFSVSFEARVNFAITLAIDGKSHAFTVQGYGLNSGQVASDANWQLAYSRAFEDFLSNFDRELSVAGL